MKYQIQNSRYLQANASTQDAAAVAANLN